MSKYDLITHDYLLSILDYNPETGIFVWRPRTPDMFKSGKQSKRHTCNTWNSKWPGKIAGLINSAGHIQICINSRLYLAHRVAWFYVYGEWPKSILDHKDGNRKNNKISNLRLANFSKNGANSKTPITNSSGYKGVSFKKDKKKYRAQIKVNGVYKHLGYFKDPEKAYKAYCRAAKKNHGEFARFK